MQSEAIRGHQRTCSRPLATSSVRERSTTLSLFWKRTIRRSLSTVLLEAAGLELICASQSVAINYNQSQSSGLELICASRMARADERRHQWHSEAIRCSLS